MWGAFSRLGEFAGLSPEFWLRVNMGSDRVRWFAKLS